MAQLKSTVVQGSLRATDSIYTNELWTKIIQAPTDSNGTAYGVGTNGQVLKSNGSHVYWAAESGSVTGVKGNSESSYRTGQVNITAANIGLGNVENTKLSTWTGAGTIATVGTITTGTWKGTAVDVAHGGTGTNTFTSGALLIGNGTSAISTRTIKNMTALGDLGWTAAATDIYIPTVNTLAYWNGRYNSSTSNLTYCNKGAFGNAATYGVDDATANGALGTGTGLTTERSVYYGLVTVNNASQTRATGIYAPTSAGTANQILVSAGGTSAPTWKATASGAAYATSANGALTFGTLPVAQGGTGLTSSPSILINLASTTAADVLSASPRPGITGTLGIGNGGTGATTADAAWTALGGGDSGKHAENYYALAGHTHAANAVIKSTDISWSNVATYTYSDSWITANTAIVATDLQYKKPAAIIEWVVSAGKIVFTCSAACTISFSIMMLKQA